MPATAEKQSRLAARANKPKPPVADQSNVFWRTLYKRQNETARVHVCEGHTVILRVTIFDDEGGVVSDVFTPIYGAQIRTVNEESRIVGGQR